MAGLGLTLVMLGVKFSKITFSNKSFRDCQMLWIQTWPDIVNYFPQYIQWQMFLSASSQIENWKKKKNTRVFAIQIFSVPCDFNYICWL